MKPPFRPTLVQLFVLATLAAAAAIGVTFYAFLEASRRTVVERSDHLRDAEAVRIGARLSAELGIAATALDDVERAMHFGALRADDPAAIESRLFSELLSHPTISDISLTHADWMGQAPKGQLAPRDRWQTSVFRAAADPDSEIVTRRISMDGESFVADVRHRPLGGTVFGSPFRGEGEVADPTSHPTFEASISERVYGRAIWSDLSFSELDSTLPEAERRVVVTVQKAVEDASGHFVGVLRVGVLTRRIDDLPRLDTTSSQQVLLCDTQGRLLARLDPADRIAVIGDDLRIQAARMKPEVSAALGSRSLRSLSADSPERSERIRVGGITYLVTFRALENSQGWVVGILVPEDYYTSDLQGLRRGFFLAILIVTAIVLFAGGFVLLKLQSALGRVVASTGRMRQFDFAPSGTDAPLREMTKVMESLERAKTSMRALGKYVPMDLVRELYEANREPELGGELLEISIMFSDIEGFTSVSERMAPDALALALGHYLEAMTRGVRGTGGTVDKFIGDSVMAFWNAPTRHADHAKRACSSALACIAATRDLYASPAWNGLSPFYTRFGLHRATVMVGHFGAPERLSYTAMGDGVNLASRLEGLCKQYGVMVLASEAVATEASSEFAFRFIDRVAVKGKAESVRVYELLGKRADSRVALEHAAQYERALEAYFARDFARALGLVAALREDAPSRVLASRCRAMLSNPPPHDWDGVYVATTK